MTPQERALVSIEAGDEALVTASTKPVGSPAAMHYVALAGAHYAAALALAALPSGLPGPGA